MVAGCPKCSARYRVDAERIGPSGAKLRCTKCSAVFLVRAPRARVEDPAAAPAVSAQAAAAERPAASQEVQMPPPPPPPPPPPTPEIDPARLVIVADPDAARAKGSVEAIEGWGLTAHVVHDGVEAMLAIQRMLPAAVVLDAALPKMYGSQVCEVVKRNESLRHTLVVLVGVVHDQDPCHREGADLYGADVYVEQPDLPEGLRLPFRESGLLSDDPDAERASPPSAVEAPVAAPPEAAPAPAIEPAPVAPAPEAGREQSYDPASDSSTMESVAPPPAPSVAADVPPVPEEEDSARAEERERAQRLARIAVSEMLLYQPDKFDQAMRQGTLEQALDLEIQEARALLRQRISEEVRAETDFIMDELARVCAERSQQG